MQVFSPVSNFKEIASCLDPKRLNKQKVELYQILKVISLGDEAKGWCNHPAVKMVRNHELFFIDYGLEIAHKCIEKGWKDTLIPKIKEFRSIFHNDSIPVFWNNSEFHSSHRAALLFKNFDYYKQFGWAEQPKLDYIWPK